MSYTKTKGADNEHCADEYLAVIPKNLWNLLVPANPEELADFCATTHKLRIREVERDYVMDLQRVYRMPIRPNESIKATMIRVRLMILKQRLKHHETGHRNSLFDELPVDPFE
jgi:hypothetical protein